MMTSCRRIGDLVLRMQQDFLDTPALALTLPDAEQRFGTDRRTCEAVLDTLVEAGVLLKARGSTYRRLFPRLLARTA